MSKKNLFLKIEIFNLIKNNKAKTEWNELL